MNKVVRVVSQMYGNGFTHKRRLAQNISFIHHGDSVAEVHKRAANKPTNG